MLDEGEPRMVDTTLPDHNPVGTLRKLLHDQLLGVLGSQFEGAPYLTLVAFAPANGERTLVFATARSTRKYRNLVLDNRCSMLVDNRDNTPDDFADAAAATAIGTCRELDGKELTTMSGVLVARHPQLSDFVRSPSCAVMALDVERYVLVWRFQQVVEIRPE
jgi:hypothetical protein